MLDAEAKSIRLYIIEEQEIYRELYSVILSSRPDTELLQVSSNGDIADLSEKVAAVGANVLLLSARRLGSGVMEELEKTRHIHPEMGIVLLLMSYDDEVMESLRKLTAISSGGMALFMKQSLDLTEQLCGIISAVSQGQVILDPLLTAALLSDKPESPFLKQLTTRELEILALVSQGYTNARIGQSLFIDVKTVEHHINSTYGKLKSEADFSEKHPRVSAARLYLQATGELVVARAR